MIDDNAPPLDTQRNFAPTSKYYFLNLIGKIPIVDTQVIVKFLSFGFFIFSWKFFIETLIFFVYRNMFKFLVQLESFEIQAKKTTKNGERHIILGASVSLLKNSFQP